MTNRSKGLIALAVVAVVVLGGGLWYFFLRDDAPAEVSLESATEQLTSTTVDGSDTSSPGDEPADPPAEGIEGTWTVDSETGEFDFESATGSFAGFRVTEELSTIGSTEAVGRTGAVDGTIEITGTTLQSADLEIDLTQITTNESRRDNKVQGSLETSEFPTATFSLTEPVDLGSNAANGEAVSVDAKGELTIHGETRDVAVALEAQLVDGTAVVVGSIPITFSDYGVETPTAPLVLSVSDEGTVEFQLLFVR